MTPDEIFEFSGLLSESDYPLRVLSEHLSGKLVVGDPDLALDTLTDIICQLQELLNELQRENEFNAVFPGGEAA